MKYLLPILAGLWSATVICGQSPTKDALALKPEKGTLVFYVIGDWGRNGDYNQKDVAAAMRKCAGVHSPDFIISTGDNFYSDGVASVNDPQWRSSFEDIYTGNDLQKNWYVVLGNHDYHRNPQAEVDYTQVSSRWRMPARYFTQTNTLKDGKKVRFIYLDTTPLVKKYYSEKEEYSDMALQDTARQMKWLDSLLLQKDDWKIVVGHHPVYSSSKRHGSTDDLVKILKPKLEKNKVQAYFCGHDHDLQHQQPKGSYVDYFLSGAGSEIRESATNEMTKFAQSIPGFAIVTIKANTLTLYYVSSDMKVLYSYTRLL